jgi:hypothetical protein
VLTLVALPAETAYSFTRLFRVNGTAGRPLTLDQGSVFDWVDRTVGRGADVTMLPYPQLPGDYWASVASWWDVEFWNASVDRAAYYPGQFVGTPSTFPARTLSFDPLTGVATPRRRGSCSRPRASRFRISGAVVTLNRETLLIDAGDPWRADWLSSGLDDDGWTRPGSVARIGSSPPDQTEPCSARSCSRWRRRPPGGAIARPQLEPRANGGAGDGGRRHGRANDRLLPAHARLHGDPRRGREAHRSTATCGTSTPSAPVPARRRPVDDQRAEARAHLRPAGR